MMKSRETSLQFEVICDKWTLNISGPDPVSSIWGDASHENRFVVTGNVVIQKQKHFILKFIYLRIRINN